MLLNFSLKKLNKTGLVVFLLTQSFTLYAEVDVPGHDAEYKHGAADSSQWPGQTQMDKEVIPPPPPGPYMSLALSDAKRHNFQQGEEKPATGFETSDVPIQAFSPDIPWPDSVREPNPWMPEQGYRFVQPSAAQGMNQQPYAMQPNTYGYNRPYGNNMGSQWVPSQGAMPNAPHGNYSPGYGYPYYQPPAYQPPANYYYGAPVNPMNHAPYPVPNQMSYPN